MSGLWRAAIHHNAAAAAEAWVVMQLCWATGGLSVSAPAVRQRERELRTPCTGPSLGARFCGPSLNTIDSTGITLPQTTLVLFTLHTNQCCQMPCPKWHPKHSRSSYKSTLSRCNAALTAGTKPSVRALQKCASRVHIGNLKWQRVHPTDSWTSQSCVHGGHFKSTRP